MDSFNNLTDSWSVCFFAVGVYLALIIAYFLLRLYWVLGFSFFIFVFMCIFYYSLTDNFSFL